MTADDGGHDQKAHSNTQNHGGFKGKSNPSTDRLQEMEKRLEQLEQKNGKPGPTTTAAPKKKRDYTNFTCHLCGQKGHIRYQCPKADEIDKKPEQHLN